jgi:hypothetical protein
MTLDEQRRVIGELVLDLLAGRTSCADVIARIERLPTLDWTKDRELDTTYHLLQHFLADEDIRLKDSAYAAAEREGLRRHAQSLIGKSLRRTLAELVLKVASGDISVEDAISQMDSWGDTVWKDKKLRHAYETLSHFWYDADIRSRDPEYARGLIEGLQTEARWLTSERHRKWWFW